MVTLKIGKDTMIQFVKEDRNSYGLRGLPDGSPFFHKYSNMQDRRKERQKLYNTSEWIETRDYMRQKYPLCQDCLKKGLITPMEEVHHLKSPFARGISLEEKYKRAFSEDNLICLCKNCHIKRHCPDGTIKDKILKYS